MSKLFEKWAKERAEFYAAYVEDQGITRKVDTTESVAFRQAIQLQAAEATEELSRALTRMDRAYRLHPPKHVEDLIAATKGEAPTDG